MAAWAVTLPGRVSEVNAIRTSTVTVFLAGTVKPGKSSSCSPPPKTPICSSRSVDSQLTRCSSSGCARSVNSSWICSAVSVRSSSVSTRTGWMEWHDAEVVLVRSRNQVP